MEFKLASDFKKTRQTFGVLNSDVYTKLCSAGLM